MEINKTSAIKPNKLNVLVYGNSGAGKTTLLGSLPNKTLIISRESGLLSLRGFEIDYIEPKTLKELRLILVNETMLNEYDNIAFDSLTEIASMFLDEATLSFPDDRQALKKWGYFSDAVTKFIKYTRDLDKNVIFTCLEKTSEDNMGRRFNVPDIQGQLSKKLPAFFDFVFNLQVIEKEEDRIRVLLTQPFDGFICKDRSGRLDAYEKPNLTSIIDKAFS